MLRKFLRFVLKHNIHEVLTPAKRQRQTPKPTIEWLSDCSGQAAVGNPQCGSRDLDLGKGIGFSEKFGTYGSLGRWITSGGTIILFGLFGG